MEQALTTASSTEAEQVQAGGQPFCLLASCSPSGRETPHTTSTLQLQFTPKSSGVRASTGLAQWQWSALACGQERKLLPAARCCREERSAETSSGPQGLGHQRCRAFTLKPDHGYCHSSPHPHGGARRCKNPLKRQKRL